MFSNLRSNLLDVVQNFDKMSFEEHVKDTCIEKLDACINYLSIPSVERKIERELEKEKRETLNQETNVLGSNEQVMDTVSTVNLNKEIKTIKVVNDQL